MGYLAQGEHSVGDIARSLQMEQPQTSKHLKVLLKVDLVRVREAGKQRMYRLNPPALKPIYSWIQPFEQLWNERLDRLDEYLAHKGER